MKSIRNQFVLVLLVVIAVSGLVTYAGNLVLARVALDKLVTQNDLVVARDWARSLAAYYADCGTWKDVRDEVQRLRATGRYLEPEDPGELTDDAGSDDLEAWVAHEARELKSREVPLIITDARGEVVFNGLARPERTAAASAVRLEADDGQPIVVDGQTAGYLFFRTMVARVYNPRERQFFESLTTSLGTTLAVQFAIALVLGLVLASRFVRPITGLESAVKRISEGSLQEHVEVAGPQEIASLSYHFNLMVDQLRAQETARQNLLADLAHELRTPVSILQANLEMMIEGVYPADKARLASLHEETQLLAKLIGDLRTISDLELGAGTTAPQDVDASRVVAEVCERHRPKFDDRGVTLAVEAGRLLHALADPLGLTQVVSNLLDNALKYAPEGRRVEVEVRADGDHVVLEVRDEGPGVAPDEVERIFERFYRAEKSRNRERGGRGLGLALCRQFVTAWGGTITAANRPQGGLTVRLELRGSQASEVTHGGRSN